MSIGYAVSLLAVVAYNVPWTPEIWFASGTAAGYAGYRRQWVAGWRRQLLLPQPTQRLFKSRWKPKPSSWCLHPLRRCPLSLTLLLMSVPWRSPRSLCNKTLWSRLLGEPRESEREIEREREGENDEKYSPAHDF
jgi:hypothetical protein